MTHNQFTSFKIMNSDFADTVNVDLWSVGECIFCREKIDEDSKILNCLHIICKDCTMKKSTDLGIQCRCKMVTYSELIDYLIMPPNKSQVKVCCEKNCQVIAKKICMYCKSVYCKPCSKTHSIKNEDHNPALMMTYPLKKEFVSCPECMEKCVEVFCTSCLKMICPLCHLNCHQLHNFKLLTTMGIETKAEFQSLLKDISEDNHHFNSLIQMSDKNIEKLKSEEKKINEEVDKTFNMLYEKMKNRSFELKKKIEKNVTDAVNSINMNKEVLNCFIKENDYYHSVTSSVINHNKTLQHVQLSKIIKDRMVVARSHAKDMPEEAKNCKVEFVFNGEQSIKECVKSIEGIGNIISPTIVNLSEFKNAVDSDALKASENDRSFSLRSVEPGIIKSRTIKVEKVKNEITDEDSDSSDFEPLVSCSCCNQWTEELISCVCCNRFYHNDCHIPPLAKELTPKDPSILKWKCTLCHEVPIQHFNITNHNDFISSTERKLIERILMELYCQNEDSEHYRDCLNIEIYPQYYKKVKDPISLNNIKERLECNSSYYKSLVDVLKDLRKVFLNGKLYYENCDPYYKSAEELEISLDRMISSWIPTLNRAIL